MIDFLYLDIETTGLNPQQQDLIQIACIPIIAGLQREPFNQYCQPINYATIEDKAIEIHGISVERMRTFQTSAACLDRFISFLRAFETKFTLAGYNVNFDRSFIGAWFNKHGRSEEYRELFNTGIHDVMRRAKAAKLPVRPKSFKLIDICAVFDIDLTSAHDALHDISATIKLDDNLSKLLGDIRHRREAVVDVIDKVFEEPVPLHVHSEYSIRDSMISMEDWTKWCIDNKVSAFACLDHDYAISLYKAANPKVVVANLNKVYKTSYDTNVVKIIPGLGLNVKILEDDDFYVRVSAWAINNTGYLNLIKLSTLGWQRPWLDEANKDGTEVPVLLLKEVVEYSEGLIIGLGCDNGVVGKCLMMGMDPSSRVEVILNSFSDVVAELLPLDVEHVFDTRAGFISVPDSLGGNLTQSINRWTWENLIKKRGIPYIVSTLAHFIVPEDKLLQDCVVKSSYKDGRSFCESRHHRSSSECFTILKRHLGDDWKPDDMEQAIKTSRDIAERVCISIKMDFHLPKIDIPEHIKRKTDNYDKQLFHLMMEKIQEYGRWNNDPVYVERFKKEIDVICKNKTLNFLPYFMIYEDIGRFARENGILQNIARGSAGGCLLSYYLKIIHIDPIEHDLPFERFLSHARINAGSFPDIDSDQSRRGPIIRYLQKKYGPGFAQLGTFQKYKVKSAIKEAMFALYGRNRNDQEIKDLCDSIPDSPQGLDEYKFVYGYTDVEGIHHEGEVDRNELLSKFFIQYPDVENIVKRMIGLIANIGRHASGFVISSLDLAGERVPLMSVMDHDAGQLNVTQYDASMVEKSGLIKADILSVTTVDVVADCVAAIKSRHGIDLLEEDDKGVAAIYRLPEDPAVYDDFYKCKTDSSFQFNTDLIKKFLPDFKPTCRTQLSDLTALVRPGSLDVEVEPGVSATQYYVDVRRGRREARYIHPDLKEILEVTNGVVVYQEQILKILVQFCGYTLEESDQIRSAIAKKKRDVMVKAFEQIRTETVKRGWTLEQAEQLCNVLIAFSNYSFNKSHSFSYGSMGYITMWLKHHYPLEWWCAELNHSDEDKVRRYTPILGKMIKQPQLNCPSDKWSIVEDCIVAPLSAVKGIGTSCVTALLQKGDINSFSDFITNSSGVRFTSGHFVAAVKARAIDCFIDPKGDYFEQRRKLIETYEKTRRKELTAEIKTKDPLKIFLMERETNKCFNRTLTNHELLVPMLQNRWPALSPTKNRLIPFLMGDIPVVGSVSAVIALLDSAAETRVGFFGLFQSSALKKGISKKNGKEWTRVDVVLSDGIQEIGCIMWRQSKPFRRPVDSICYVLATINKDWRGKPQLDLVEVDFFYD